MSLEKARLQVIGRIAFALEAVTGSSQPSAILRTTAFVWIRNTTGISVSDLPIHRIGSLINEVPFSIHGWLVRGWKADPSCGFDYARKCNQPRHISSDRWRTDQIYPQPHLSVEMMDLGATKSISS